MSALVNTKWDFIKTDYRAFVLGWEGGYVNDPDDPGKETNMGVTLATFKSLAPKLLGKQGTLDNLKALTKDEHFKFLKHFWDDVNGDLFDNPVIAAYITELAWGSGEYGAEKNVIDEAVARFGKKIKVDGQISPADVAIMNSIPADKFFDALTAERLEFYQSIKTWWKFGKGWTRRINDFVNRFKKKAASFKVEIIA